MVVVFADSACVNTSVLPVLPTISLPSASRMVGRVKVRPLPTIMVSTPVRSVMMAGSIALSSAGKMTLSARAMVSVAAVIFDVSKPLSTSAWVKPVILTVKLLLSAPVMVPLPSCSNCLALRFSTMPFGTVNESKPVRSVSVWRVTTPSTPLSNKVTSPRVIPVERVEAV